MRERLLSFLPGHAIRARRAKVSREAGSSHTLPLFRLSEAADDGRAPQALESISQLHLLLSNPIAGRKLRDFLSQRCGSRSIDFLVSYWTFSKSRNALERYQQLRFLVVSLAADHVARPAHLSEHNRLRLVKEWQPWEASGRVPLHARFPGLDAAAQEIEQAALLQSGLQLRRTRKKS